LFLIRELERVAILLALESLLTLVFFVATFFLLGGGTTISVVTDDFFALGDGTFVSDLFSKLKKGI